MTVQNHDSGTATEKSHRHGNEKQSAAMVTKKTFLTHVFSQDSNAEVHAFRGIIGHRRRARFLHRRGNWPRGAKPAEWRKRYAACREIR